MDRYPDTASMAAMVEYLYPETRGNGGKPIGIFLIGREMGHGSSVLTTVFNIYSAFTREREE